MTGRALALAALVCAGSAAAQVPAERVGDVAKIPSEMGAHWIWASDQVLGRSALFDADSGRMLGMVDGGEGVTPLRPLISRARHEVYVVETVYSRGHRGTRTDLVTIYDASTLDVKGEVVIPPERADNGNGAWTSALLDGDRFLVVFNQSPGMSVTVVDLEQRRVAGKLATGGCALVLPVGPRRFGMLCGDGTALAVELDDAGREKDRSRSGVFFDPTRDPLTEKGVRNGHVWLFASFEGQLQPIDFAATPPAPAQPWPLFDAAEQSAGWRIGGIEHLALHEKSGRLYSVVHQGGPGTHKDAGPEVWVYDVAQKKCVQRIEVGNLTAAFLRPQLGIEPGGVVDWLLKHVLPNPGADAVAVTQDETPLLFAGERQSGAVGVYDARSGAHLRDIEEVGIGGGLLVVP